MWLARTLVPENRSRFSLRNFRRVASWAFVLANSDQRSLSASSLRSSCHGRAVLVELGGEVGLVLPLDLLLHPLDLLVDPGRGHLHALGGQVLIQEVDVDQVLDRPVVGDLAFIDGDGVEAVQEADHIAPCYLARLVMARHRGEDVVGTGYRRGACGGRGRALARRALLTRLLLAVARTRHSQGNQGQHAGSDNPEHRRLSLSDVQHIRRTSRPPLSGRSTDQWHPAADPRPTLGIIRISRISAAQVGPDSRRRPWSNGHLHSRGSRWSGVGAGTPPPAGPTKMLTPLRRCSPSGGEHLRSGVSIFELERVTL